MSNPLTDIAEGEPARVVAGDTWTWMRSDLAADYPTAAWALTYSLRREGDGTVKTITATESGTVYTALVTHTDSANYAAGTWHWQAHMTRASDSARVRVDYGVLVVEANGATAADPRSHAVRTLAAIESLIEGRATKDVNSYSIAGRSLTKMSPDELIQWRDYYRREVAREQRAELARQGKATGRTSVVRFRT